MLARVLLFLLIAAPFGYAEEAAQAPLCRMPGNRTTCPDGSSYASATPSDESTRSQILGNFSTCLQRNGVPTDRVVSLEAINRLERSCGFAPRPSPLQAAQVSNRLLLDNFFQDLGQRSRQQINCRIDAMDQYLNGTPVKKADFHRRAASAYQEIRERLEPLARYREQLEREALMNEGYANSGACMPPFHTSPECTGSAQSGGFARGTLTNVNAEIAKQCVQMPFGYEPEMCEQLVATALTGRYDAAIVERGIQRVRDKYYAGSQTYCNVTLPSEGNFGYLCLSDEYRRIAVSSGQAEALIDSYPASVMDDTTKQLLRCQVRSEYLVSQNRQDGLLLGGTILAVAATLIPTNGASAQLVVGGVGIAAASAGLAVQLDQAYRSCSRAAEGNTFIISSEGARSCNAEESYSRAIDRASWGSCLLNSGLAAVNAVTIPASVMRVVRSARGAPSLGRTANPNEATLANVAANPGTHTQLSGRTLQRVEQAAGRGRLRMVEIEPGTTQGTFRELPVDIVPGRYYVVVRNDRGLVLTDYPLRHGGHRRLANELGLPAPRKLDTDGTPAGGVVFYDDGVVVSGQSLRYPNQRSADDIASVLRSMGFRILERRSGPIRGPNSSEVNPFDGRNIPLGP